ncbi:MAG: hypothetical protein KUG77_13515 [Nannocystaceae bacterium]|nr:hypothetical protein [Nannocystaceae bacterium]
MSTNVTAYCLHTYLANTTPAQDFSGSAVWNATGSHTPTMGPHRNEHFAHDGLVIMAPEGLNTLSAGMVDIQGSPYKAANLFLMPQEHDEASNFVVQLSAHVGKAAILSVLGWGNDENGVITCYHSMLYWTVIKDPGSFHFAVFAAANQRILPGNVSAEPQYIDCGKDNNTTITSPTGRLSSMSNSAFLPPGIASNAPSPELLNASFPQIG